MNFYIIASLIIIGILAGVLSGIMGVGGGVIMIPLLVFLLGFSQHQAQGTSLAALLPPVTLLAVINYYKADYINWKYALIIASTFIIGGYFGSKLAISIDQKILKKIFGILLLVIGAKLVFWK